MTATWHVELLRSRAGSARALPGGGTATWRQLDGPCTQHAVRTAVRDGRLLRVGRGRYCLPGLPDVEQVLASGGCVLSHLSAAVHHGLAVPVVPDAVHVTRARGARSLQQPGVVTHTCRSGLPQGRETTPLQTVLECAALPFPEAPAVADSALRTGLVPADALLRAADARRGAGRERVLRVARAADARAGSASSRPCGRCCSTPG